MIDALYLLFPGEYFLGALIFLLPLFVLQLDIAVYNFFLTVIYTITEIYFCIWNLYRLQNGLYRVHKDTPEIILFPWTYFNRFLINKCIQHCNKRGEKTNWKFNETKKGLFTSGLPLPYTYMFDLMSTKVSSSFIIREFYPRFAYTQIAAMLCIFVAFRLKAIPIFFLRASAGPTDLVFLRFAELLQCVPQ